MDTIKTNPIEYILDYVILFKIVNVAAFISYVSYITFTIAFCTDGISISARSS